MSILQRAALNWFGSTPPAQRDPGIFYDRGGPASDSGITVTHESAMTFSAVYACTRLLSFDLASLPTGVFANYGAKRYAMPAPPWLSEPNPELSWFTFAQQIKTSVLLGGDVFAVKVKDRAGVTQEMWPLDPRLVTVDRDPTTRELVYEVSGGTLTRADMLHIPGLMLPGYLRGLSVVEYARQTIGLGLGAEKHGAKQMANSATPSVVVSVDGKVDDASAERFSAQFMKKQSGLDNVGKPVVVGGGAKITTLSMTNDQLEWLASRHFEVSEIARWFGVPAHMIGENEKNSSWGTGIEQQEIAYVTHTLRPWLTLFEGAFRPLVRDWAKSQAISSNVDWFLSFNVNGLLRGDSAGRAALYDSLMRNGAVSPNWILAKENENPYEGGDAHYMQTSYAPIGKNGELVVPESAPAPPAPEPDSGL